MSTLDTKRSRLGPYELGREIGPGSFGIVSLARDAKNNRTVALKQIKPAIGMHPQLLPALARAARRALDLKHPCIATTLDVSLEHPPYYIATAYLAGGSLADLLRREGKLSDLSRINVIIQEAASGLALAHKAGIIHGDLKPENLLLDAGGHVSVTDFGYVRALQAASAKSPVTGVLYTAPEVILGQLSDERTDTYSLAAVLYQLLTGQSCLDPKSLDAAGTPQRKPTLLPPSAVRTDVPGSVDRVVLKALSPEPGSRYESVMDFASAFASAAAEPAAAPAPAIQTPVAPQAKAGQAAGVVQVPPDTFRRPVSSRPPPVAGTPSPQEEPALSGEKKPSGFRDALTRTFGLPPLTVSLNSNAGTTPWVAPLVTYSRPPAKWKSWVGTALILIFVISGILWVALRPAPQPKGSDPVLLAKYTKQIAEGGTVPKEKDIQGKITFADYLRLKSQYMQVQEDIKTNQALSDARQARNDADHAAKDAHRAVGLAGDADQNARHAATDAHHAVGLAGDADQNARAAANHAKHIDKTVTQVTAPVIKVEHDAGQ